MKSGDSRPQHRLSLRRYHSYEHDTSDFSENECVSRLNMYFGKRSAQKNTHALLAIEKYFVKIVIHASNFNVHFVHFWIATTAAGSTAVDAFPARISSDRPA